MTDETPATEEPQRSARTRGRLVGVWALVALGFAVVFFGCVVGVAFLPTAGPLVGVVAGPILAAAIAVVLLVVARWRLRSFTVTTAALALLAGNAVGLLLASAGDLMLPVPLFVSADLGDQTQSTGETVAGAAAVITAVAWLASTAIWTTGALRAVRRTASGTASAWLPPLLAGAAMAAVQVAAYVGVVLIAVANGVN